MPYQQGCQLRQNLKHKKKKIRRTKSCKATTNVFFLMYLINEDFNLEKTLLLRLELQNKLDRV